MDWWKARGAGPNVAVDLAGNVPLGLTPHPTPMVAAWRRCRMLSSCPSRWRMRGAGGLLKLFDALGFRRISCGQCPPRTEPCPPKPPLLPPAGHCMTGTFFFLCFLVFFGAATKCAMCYVAWFIIFLQATKLICSPNCISCVLRGITRL